MHLVGGDAKALARLPRDPGEQDRGIMVVEPVEGLSQTVVMQHVRRDACPNRCSTGLVAKNCETDTAGDC